MVDFEGLEGPIFDRDSCKTEESDDGLELILNHRYGAIVRGLLYDANERTLYVDIETEYGRNDEAYFHDTPSVTIPKETEHVKLRTVTYVNSIFRGLMEHLYAKGYMPDIILQKRL